MFDFTDENGDRHIINPAHVVRIFQAKGKSSAKIFFVGSIEHIRMPGEKVVSLVSAVAKVKRSQS